MKTIPEKILAATLARIAQDGWTKLAFDRAVKSCGATPAEAKKHFPDGIADIAAAFHQSIDDAMLAAIKAKRNFPTMRVRDKITFAVRARLESATPHREAVRRLMIWSLLPQNIRAATQSLWHAADIIWQQVGDTSTDYNYYTKRLLLIGVMKTTLAFWLNDQTPDQAATWDFLDRRIEDIMKLGKGISIAKTVGLSDILSFVKSRFVA